MFRFKPKCPQVQIGQVKSTKDMNITDGRLYELISVSYTRLDLEPGTVLEVVSTPDKPK